MLYRLILTGILASTPMFAQRGGGGGGRGGSNNNVPMISSGGSRLDRISEALKLSKDQKKDFKAAMDEAQKETAPIHDQLVKSRQAIAEAIAASKSPEEITPLVNSSAALDTQIAGIELKTFAAFYKSLDKDQQSKPGMPMVFQGMKGIFNGKNLNSSE